MAGRMPVLGQHDVVKLLRQSIDHRNHFVPARHRRAHRPGRSRSGCRRPAEGRRHDRGQSSGSCGHSSLFDARTTVELRGSVHQGLADLRPGMLRRRRARRNGPGRHAELTRGMFPDLGERLRGLNRACPSRMTSWSSGSPSWRSSSSDSMSPAMRPSASVAPPDLLAARPGRLAGGSLAPRPVRHIPAACRRNRAPARRRTSSGWCRCRSRRSAHWPPSSPRRASSSRPPLAKIVTSAQAALVENAPHALRQRDQIAAVEAHRARSLMPRRLEPRRQRHDLSGRGLGVVGVDQQHQVVGPRARKSSNAAVSSSCAWMKECAIVPKIGMPNSFRPAPSPCRQSRRYSSRARPAARPRRRAHGAGRNRPAACPARREPCAPPWTRSATENAGC